MTIYVPAVIIFATVTILEIAGRLSNERRPATAVGLALAIPALALGLYDYGLLALTLLVCQFVRWARSLARRLARNGLRQGRREVVEDSAVDRSEWPTSGPIC